MSLTDLNVVSEQVQKFWAPMFSKELRESLLLGSLVNKEYQGQIKAEGDTVYVSQMIAPEGQLKTVGVDADTFDSEQLGMNRISIQANKLAIASLEVSDLAVLQSQLGSQDSAIRDGLRFAIEKKMNDYLYSLVSPSTSAPDHLISGVTDFNATQMLSIRMLAAQAKWAKDKGWWLLVDPSYYNDLLNAQTMTSADYVGDKPVIGGQIATQRFGFNILEDNSRSTDFGLAFHPDFMHLVMQEQVSFKVSDLHSQKKRGYLISCEMIFGAALGHDGAKKHIKIYNS